MSTNHPNPHTQAPNSTNLSTPSSLSPQQTFTLLLFAASSTYTSHSSLMLPAPTTLSTLFYDLEHRYPGINAQILRSSQVVVNLEYVDCEIAAVVDGVLERIATTGSAGGSEQQSSMSESESGGKGGGKVAARKKWEGDDMRIEVGDEVGIVPPVSSG